jgi:Spy/CpxP family protein refolding chaperone
MNHFFRLLRYTLILPLLLAGTIQVHAQNTDQRQERMSRIENAKIAFLTDKLSLTQEQAQRFWPIYNEFTDKRKELGQRQRQLRSTNVESLNDQQIRDLIKQNVTLRQNEVNLEKEYYDKFQKVLSVRQTGQLLVAEREFTREILQKLGGSRRGGPPAPAGAAN